MIFSTLAKFFSVALAFAQSQGTITINPNIPQFQGIANTSPCGWLVNFYGFALFFSGILAFGAIVFGGFLYATSAGNASRQKSGKDWIQSALLGLLLLAGAYLILNVINPSLTTCSLPSLATVGTSGSSFGPGAGAPLGPGGVGPGAGAPSAGGLCQAPTAGPCSLAQLGGSCFGNAQIAAGVCNSESSGNPNAQGDKCDDGNYASIGLFQINLSANTIKDAKTGQTLNCNQAFSNPYTGSSPHCRVTNQALYQQCLASAKDPATNIAKACELSKSGTNWKQWGPATLRACGL